MSLFLASVATVAEAELAVAGGADIIDFKDPARGALGALAPEVVRESHQAVGGRRPTSAVTGDLPMQPGTLAAAAARMAATGVDYVKVGLFADPRRDACIDALAGLAAGTALIGVLFADEEVEIGMVDRLAEAGFAGAMLDTARKSEGGLIAHRDLGFLAAFVARARDRGLLAGLAGSLEPPDVPRLLPLAPDILGFRGALCAGARDDAIDAGALALVRGLIPADARARNARGADSRVDFRLLGGRGYAVEPPPDEEARADRVFVRDFVLPISIGAYRREHGAPQRVRFNVEASVRRGGEPAADMRDVLSYDIITDGIRMIVAKSHVDLAETLAERVAEMVLAQPRVAKVTVRVEKLDVGPAVVGVEITREKVAQAAALYRNLVEGN